jgi:membrane protein YqaA with SNARE-associated domain
MHKIIFWYAKSRIILLAVFKPLGIWGLGILALIDAGSMPIPIDPIVALYAWNNKMHFFLYCIVAALGSTIGALAPYYVGRAGGELFLLKHVNRKRFESMRDRFERQEFLAIMVPAMMPPPTPIKLFEFAAGVFEMRPLWYASAVFAGRLVRFSVVAVLTIFYGPGIIKICMDEVYHHRWVVFAISAAVVVALVIYVKRRMRKKITIPQ